MIALQAFNDNVVLASIVEMNSLFQNLLSTNDSELLCRLYRKYIKRDDVDSTIQLLKSSTGKIDMSYNKLLGKLISACEKGKDYVDLCSQTFGVYKPLRLVILDEPYFSLSLNIPLEDYDNNDGEPFWMRPQYILDHYSQTCGDYKYKD